MDFVTSEATYMESLKSFVKPNTNIEEKGDGTDELKKEIDDFLSMQEEKVKLNNRVELIERSMEIPLKDAGIDPKKVVIQNFYGKKYILPESVLSGEPLFFTCDNGGQKKMKVYILEDVFPKEMSNEQAIHFFSQRVDAAAREAGKLLNSKTATPWYIRWLTGSSEYQRMQKAFAAYKNVTVDKTGTDIESVANSTARRALMELGSAARNYFKHKRVSLLQYPNFEIFTTTPRYERMSEAERARMKAAYSAYAVSTGYKMYSNWINQKDCVILDDDSYKTRVSYANAFIWYDPLFKKSNAVSNSNNEMERKLQEDLKNVLFAFDSDSDPGSDL